MGPGSRALPKVLALVCGLGLLFAGSASAAGAVYAGPAGKDSGNDCTVQSKPCTFQKALNEASVGGEVVVEPGEYSLAQIIDYKAVDVHGEVGKPRPVLIDVAAYNLPLIFESSGAARLAHLEIQSSPGDGYALATSFGEVEDLVIKGPVSGGGVLLRAGGLLRDSAIDVSPQSSGSEIGGVVGYGGAVRNVTSYATGEQSFGIVAENFFGGSGAVALSAVNVIASGGLADVGARNLNTKAGSATLTIDHSAFGTYLAQGLSTAVVQTNTVSAPPLLADSAAGDFRELAGSPTIDAGITDPANGTVDIEGNARTQGGGADIGAFEFAPSPRPPPPPGVPPTITPSSPPGARTSPLPLTLTGVGLTHRSFIAGATARPKGSKAPRGTHFTFVLSEPAAVTIAITGSKAGRRAGGSCVPATAKNSSSPKCKRKFAAGALHADEPAGAGSLAFPGLLKGKALAPGHYTAQVSARSASGQVTPTSAVAFTVIG